MAEVSAEPKQLDPLIAQRSLFKDGWRCIRAAIIHKDDFPRDIDKGILQALQHQGYRLCFIQDRNYDR